MCLGTLRVPEPSSYVSMAWRDFAGHTKAMLSTCHTHMGSRGVFFQQAVLPTSTHAAFRTTRTWPQGGRPNGVQDTFSMLIVHKVVSRYARAPTVLTSLARNIVLAHSVPGQHNSHRWARLFFTCFPIVFCIRTN